MDKTPHLLVCISGHGYGHLAQVAPVLNALLRLLPELRMTLRTTIATAHLRSRIAGKFHHIEDSSDFGMVMKSAIEVDVEASMQAYREFHADWAGRVREEAAVIRSLAPNLVLTDVAYLPLAAAAELAIPSLSMCSLNWADIFKHYCSAMPGSQQIQTEIETAYLNAQCFLRLQPSMDMPWLPRQLDMAPVADCGTEHGGEIRERIGAAAQDRLVLVSMGGIATNMSVSSWPRLPNVRWLVQQSWLQANQREDMVAFESLAMGFSELLASCDLLFTKPGYGAFVECACYGTPVLYVERDSWPEQPYLVRWLAAHVACRGLSVQQVAQGNFSTELSFLLQQPRGRRFEAEGNLQVATYILGLLQA